MASLFNVITALDDILNLKYFVNLTDAWEWRGAGAGAGRDARIEKVKK